MAQKLKGDDDITMGYYHENGWAFEFYLLDDEENRLVICMPHQPNEDLWGRAFAVSGDIDSTKRYIYNMMPPPSRDRE